MSRLFATHLRIDLKSFSLRKVTKSFILVSEMLTRIPLSIIPDAEYLCSSFRTLRQSGKYFSTTPATAFGSNWTSSVERMPCTRLKNCPASCGFCVGGIRNSTTEHRLWRGSMIRFLKLQVRINPQFLWNSSINPRNAGCVDCGFR